ncbi:exodeoxyribonuclease V subunit alpha [Pseudactinotalea terrae]|uniref:exodeoxyribonuclease V subunit alpha n=1 Tax=Pseudactinotalea terrae TaxID=1743262 RepID=UPI0014793DF3|nr:exodeoxyribonuclease V subunit alpha [Pseudactinotalea terrae]
MSEVEAGGATVEIDPFGRERARSATGLLAELNHPDGLSAADVHVARRLAALGGCEDERVLVAAALAVRAVRQGSVCLDLGGSRVRELLDQEWEVEEWRAALLSSTLVREPGNDAVTPLVLDANRLYLDRYWAEEGQVVRDLRERGATAPSSADGLDEILHRYFPASIDGPASASGGDTFAEQRAAAEAACRGWTTVITGGPGTGKTTTIAGLLGVLIESDPSLRIALAAPTGRAAARMGEAVTETTGQRWFPAGPVTDRVMAVAESARTLHRLLGAVPGRPFRHNRSNRLPYDVVVVDETSMVSLTMMARLLDAMRPHARLVLVGDADQLASVDAGAVLGDLVTGLDMGEESAQVRRLLHSHRFGGRIGGLAAAIRDGDADRAVELLTTSSAADDEDAGVVELVTIDDVEEMLIDHAVALQEAASGDAGAAAVIRVLDQHRLLCAHREGPFGEGYWNRRIERALGARQRHSLGTWYVGRPVIVTENDYGLGLYNGDLAVVLPVDDPERSRLVAAVASGGADPKLIPVGRLPEVRSAHAMTVHRSQGSQVDEVTVLLPEDGSRLLTRQLLYTAVTRAKSRVRVVTGNDRERAAAAVRAAVGETAPRASGLAERLTR